MLVLSRKKNEVIFVGDNIKIAVLGIFPHKVSIGIECPREIKIIRDDAKKGEKHEV